MLSMALCCLSLAGAAPAPAPPSAFSTVGLYVWRDTPSQHAFWKACGINTLQFCDTHWSIRADLLDDYYARFAADISRASRSGFKTDVILFSNIAQWMGPAEREPSGTGVLLDPRDPKALESRLGALRKAVRMLQQADSFTFIAGDPGGSIRAKFGPLAADDWVAMARAVRDVVKREAPRPDFNVNPWAIAYWQYPNLGCGGSQWWVREGELTKAILAEPDLIGRSCGVQLPGHNYYRAMALRTLSTDGIRPDLLPNSDDVRALKARGTKRIWAWPYFLLDEADDGDVGPDGRIIPGVQIETRYIHRLVGQMRKIGMNGIVGNWSYAGYLAKALNTYAFARFCRDPRATPEGVIDEYAKCVADDATWRDLAQVLRFIEGQSNWQRKLPADWRLPPLVCDIQSAKAALEELGRVVPRAKPLFALPEKPQEYLNRLSERLRGMGATGAVD